MKYGMPCYVECSTSYVQCQTPGVWYQRNLYLHSINTYNIVNKNWHSMWSTYQMLHNRLSCVYKCCWVIGCGQLTRCSITGSVVFIIAAGSSHFFYIPACCPCYLPHTLTSNSQFGHFMCPWIAGVAVCCCLFDFLPAAFPWLCHYSSRFWTKTFFQLLQVQ